jgi:hypothetical protein
MLTILRSDTSVRNLHCSDFHELYRVNICRPKIPSTIHRRLETTARTVAQESCPPSYPAYAAQGPPPSRIPPTITRPNRHTSQASWPEASSTAETSDQHSPPLLTARSPAGPSSTRPPSPLLQHRRSLRRASEPPHSSRSARRAPGCPGAPQPALLAHWSAAGGRPLGRCGLRHPSLCSLSATVLPAAEPENKSDCW